MKADLLKLEYITSTERTVFLNWGKIDQKIKTFEGNANLNVFKKLYNDDAERLYEHFKNVETFSKFSTYLTREQYDLTLYNIGYNDLLYV